MKFAPVLLGFAAGLAGCAQIRLKPENNLAAGIRDGSCTPYPETAIEYDRYPGGETRNVWFYTRGVLDSLYRMDPGGTVRQVRRYHEGALHGTQLVQFVSGEPELALTHRKGALDGWQHAWHPNGSPRWEVFYQDGQEMPGTRSAWDSAGRSRPFEEQDVLRPREAPPELLEKMAKALDRQMPPMDQVYSAFLRRNPGAGGRIVLMFETDSLGNVSDAYPISTTTACKEMDLLIRLRASQVTFNKIPGAQDRIFRRRYNFEPRL